MRKISAFILTFAFAAATIVTLGGCQDTPTTQPLPMNQVAADLLIVAARAGLAQVSAAVENGYAQGKVPYVEYIIARGEEQASLDVLTGLQAKVNSGEPVTQVDINAALVRFLTPLDDLIQKYALSNLPPPQPQH